MKAAIWIASGIAVACGGIAAIWIVHDTQCPIKSPDPDLQFRFVQIVRGTNHVIYSGSLARIKRALVKSPLRSLVPHLFPPTLRAQWYGDGSWINGIAPTNPFVLWVGWTCTNYSYTVQGGIPQPARMRCHEINCIFCQPSGRSTQLMSCAGSEAPYIAEMVEAWELPATNLSGCKILLTRWKDGKQTQVGEVPYKP